MKTDLTTLTDAELLAMSREAYANLDRLTAEFNAMLPKNLDAVTVDLVVRHRNARAAVAVAERRAKRITDEFERRTQAAIEAALAFDDAAGDAPSDNNQ